MTNNEMNNNMNTTTINPESTKVDDKVIKKMIASALVNVDGYLGTANGIIGGLSGILKKNTTEEEDALSGISASLKDNEADVSIKVIVEAGKNIPAIVGDITEKVKANLKNQGGFNTKEVRVEVVDMMTKAEYDEKYSKNNEGEEKK